MTSVLVYSGEQVRVLGESYTLEDEEDSKVCQVGRLWVTEGRWVWSVIIIMKIHKFLGTQLK